MPNFATLFAIDQKTADHLLTLQDIQLLNYIKNYTEGNYYECNREKTLELTTTWDALHRSLTDGLLYYQSGSYPLNTAILGGLILYGNKENQDDYLVLLKNQIQVQAVNVALEQFSVTQLKDGYSKISIEDYNWNLGLDDMQKTIESFELLKTFWQNAAEHKLNILLTLDI